MYFHFLYLLLYCQFFFNQWPFILHPTWNPMKYIQEQKFLILSNFLKVSVTVTYIIIVQFEKLFGIGLVVLIDRMYAIVALSRYWEIYQTCDQKRKYPFIIIIICCGINTRKVTIGELISIINIPKIDIISSNVKHYLEPAVTLKEHNKIISKRIFE